MDTMLARKKEEGISTSTSEFDVADVLYLSNQDLPLNCSFFHKNFKIYSTTVRNSDVSAKRWAVQSKANAERERQGSRATSGDRLAKTAQEAIDIVEELLRQEASRARLIANAAQCEARDLSVLQGFKSDKSQIERERAYAVLMKIQQGKSRVQFVIDAVNSGHQFAAVRVFDQAAKAKDQKTMDAVRANGYILGLSNENIPLVRQGLEAKARLKANIYEKIQYQLKTPECVYVLTKIEFDFAQHLLSQKQQANVVDADDVEPEVAREQSIPTIPTIPKTPTNTAMPTLQCNSNVSQPVLWLLRDKKTGRLFLETSDLQLVESAQSSESREAIAVPNGAVIRKSEHTYAKDFARATRLRASAKDVYDIATRKLKELPLFSGKEGDVATAKLHQAKANLAQADWLAYPFSGGAEYKRLADEYERATKNAQRITQNFAKIYGDGVLSQEHLNPAPNPTDDLPQNDWWDTYWPMPLPDVQKHLRAACDALGAAKKTLDAAPINSLQAGLAHIAQEKALLEVARTNFLACPRTDGTEFEGRLRVLMDSEEAVSRIEGRVQSIFGSHVLSNDIPDDPLSVMLRNGQPVFKTFDGQHWVDFETGQQVISTKSCDLSGLRAIPYAQFHDVPENHPRKDVVLTHRTIPAPVPMFLANAQQLGLDF